MKFEKNLSNFLIGPKNFIEGIEPQRVEYFLKQLSILLALYAAFHLPELSYFTLSIDDELAAFRTDSNEWIGQGRWMTYVIERFILSQPVVPFLPLALFGLFCSTGYLLFLRALGEKHLRVLSLAFFPVFAAFPTWTYLTAFQSNTPSSGFGLFLCCLAACLYRKNREIQPLVGRTHLVIGHIISIGFLGAVAIGCYQSFILLLAVVLLLSIVSLWLAKRAVPLLLRDALAALAILVTAGALYGLIQKLFLFYTKANVDYIQGFIRPDLLLHQTKMVLFNMLKEMASVYLGGSHAYGNSAPIFGIMIIFAAIGFVIRAHTISLRKGVFFALLVMSALLTAPFGINLINGGYMPVRTLVAVPTALTGLGVLGLTYSPRWLTRTGIIALMLVYFSIFQIVSGLNATRDLVQIHDHELAGALSERIARISENTDTPKPMTLEVFGFQPFLPPYPRKVDYVNSTIGASFFEWDEGNPNRITSYLKLFGLGDFNVELPETLNSKRLDEFVQMPPWPAQGAVRIATDGTVLVKLSDVPGPRFRPVLTRQDLMAKVGDDPFYRLSTASDGSWSLQNAIVVQKKNEGIELETENDPNFLFQTGARQALQNCRRIELHTRLKVEQASSVQLLYKVLGKSDSQWTSAIDTPISPAADGKFVDVTLQMIAREGFADSFRLDPVKNRQNVTIGEIELYCRYPRLVSK